MKKFLAMLLAGLLMGTCIVQARAFEFLLQGTWQWGYDNIDQLGQAGFFGPHDAASPLLSLDGSPKFNAMNGWVGARMINGLQYGAVTGTNASLQWMRLEFQPEIRINSAVRLRGTYQIGAKGLTEYGLYANSTAYGVWNPIASGQWTQLWGTAAIPWGIVIAGKRPFSWGIGAQYDGTSPSSESFGVVAPYGPLRIGALIYPWRGQTWINSLADRAVISTTISPGPEIIPISGFGSSVIYDPTGDSGSDLSVNYRLWDSTAKRQLQPTVFVTYEAGNVSSGILYEWFSMHNGPEGARVNGITGDQRARTFDEVLENGTAYFKYNSGTLSVNAELAWVRGQRHIQKGANSLRDYTDGRGSRYQPYYMEAWKWMTETSVSAGPAKLSFLWSWVPGPDRRAGVWIGKQSWENVFNGSYFGNAHAFLPYSLLMGYQYGAGLLALNRNGEGYMTDANSYGARVDYAVAANLNVYGTFFWANRVSKGWPWGILTLANDQNNGGGRVLLLGQQVGPVASAGSGAASSGFIISAPQNGDWANGGGPFAPNIPDDNLGWEVTAGMDWRLLEGFTVRLRCAYWNVGEWFKFACVDKAVASAALLGLTKIPSMILPFGGEAIGSGWGINPNRTIDPVWMFQGVMAFDF